MKLNTLQTGGQICRKPPVKYINQNQRPCDVQADKGFGGMLS